MISARATLEINLKVIQDNYYNLQNICKPANVGAAVKANCYGLGVQMIAPVLLNSGCRNFFVASLEEGVSLRDLLGKNANIYVLNGFFKADASWFKEYKLIPVLNNLEQASLWLNFITELNQNLPCVLHFDTGMNRLGFPEKEMYQLLAQAYLERMNIAYVMSHLSSSEEIDNQANKEQLEKFNSLARLFPNSKKSFANSGGIFLGKDYHFDLVRPGIALYGANPSPHSAQHVIKNPVKLTAPIIQLKSLKPGEYVGYNRTYKAGEETIVATVPVGYADGYFRSLSNKGIVYINDQAAQVIGRVSMDLITIDVTAIPHKQLYLGQNVELIGSNMGLDTIAELAQTHVYEVLTAFGNRYQRLYVSE